MAAPALPATKQQGFFSAWRARYVLLVLGLIATTGLLLMAYFTDRSTFYSRFKPTKMLHKYQELFQQHEESAAVSSSTFWDDVTTETLAQPSPCFKSPYLMCNTSKASAYSEARKVRQQYIAESRSSRWLPKYPSAGPNVTASQNDRLGGKDGVIKVAVLNRPEYVPAAMFDFSKCEYKNCKFAGKEVTEGVHAVVANGVRLQTKLVPRWPHQVFAFMAWESPLNVGGVARRGHPWNDWFNLTITYRPDSDIFTPYSFMEYSPKPEDQQPDYVAAAGKKTKMAAWVVSHCNAPSGRDKYAKELQKHISLDVYGACGKRCPTRYPKPCLTNLNTYRFYLAFENSICDGYMTEKLFRVYNDHLVPIVRGGPDYKRWLPPNTFINTADFESPKALAEYLIYLKENPQAYSKYLKAIDQYKVGPDGINSFTCELCKRLNEVRYSKPQYYDMYSWLASDHCRRLEDV